MAERYIRPPLVATEAPSAWASVWRFRVVLLLLFALLAAGVLLVLVVVFHPNGERNPGVGAARVPAAAPWSAGPWSAGPTG